MDKNKIFASLMMTLSPVCFMVALLYIKPFGIFDYFLVFSLCGLLWFLLHSVILTLTYLLFRNRPASNDLEESS